MLNLDANQPLKWTNTFPAPRGHEGWGNQGWSASFSIGGQADSLGRFGDHGRDFGNLGGFGGLGNFGGLAALLQSLIQALMGSMQGFEHPEGKPEGKDHKGFDGDRFDRDFGNRRPEGKWSSAPVSVYIPGDTADANVVQYQDADGNWQDLDPANPPKEALTPDNLRIHNKTQDTYVNANSDGAEVTECADGSIEIRFEDRFGSQAENDNDYNDVFVTVRNPVKSWDVEYKDDPKAKA